MLGLKGWLDEIRQIRLISRDSEHEKVDPSVILAEELDIFNKIVTRDLHAKPVTTTDSSRTSSDVKQVKIILPAQATINPNDGANCLLSSMQVAREWPYSMMEITMIVSSLR